MNKPFSNWKSTLPLGRAIDGVFWGWLPQSTLVLVFLRSINAKFGTALELYP